MDHREIEDLAADALLKSRKDAYVSQTVAQMYENAITVIDVTEPMIRADERMKVGTEANAVVRAKDERIADLLEDWTDLRARVVERRAAMDTALEVAEGPVQISAAAGAMAALDEVLALIDGSK